MAKKLYEESSIQDIANAIREKNGTTTKYKVAEMGAAVMALPNEDTITHADIPSYVKAEALAVAELRGMNTAADLRGTMLISPSREAYLNMTSSTKAYITQPKLTTPTRQWHLAQTRMLRPRMERLTSAYRLKVAERI